MKSLLNPDRPPLFCPGCSHERVVRALDESFQHLGLAGEQIAIVTDIGCSGLFDTFFNTHALHGLHGRALTYASGLKLARPELTVVVIMGDGGLGIGGAHVLSSCRRNLDLCLLVLNNFNYGMTGGQCSATTPVEASTSSGFLGQLEAPLDICAVGKAAGAQWIARLPATSPELSGKICEAISHDGFSLMDITGICPGRFSRRNPQPNKVVAGVSERYEFKSATASKSIRPEFGKAYRKRSAEAPPGRPLQPIVGRLKADDAKATSILFLGAAGQRVSTAAEILCLAAMHAGLYATQKNDYPITVLRGHSISEVILDSRPIRFTGIETPDIILALSAEGVGRRKTTVADADASCIIVQEATVLLPDTAAQVITLDSKLLGLSPTQRSLAAVTLLTRYQSLVDIKLLHLGLQQRFKGVQLDKSVGLMERVSALLDG